MLLSLLWWDFTELVFIGLYVCRRLVYQVLKVAILAEKYASDYTWYVDTILHLIRIAGDHVSEEVTSYYVIDIFCI